MNKLRKLLTKLEEFTNPEVLSVDEVMEVFAQKPELVFALTGLLFQIVNNLDKYPELDKFLKDMQAPEEKSIIYRPD